MANITWITTKHPPDRGGMAQSSARLTESLKDRGHKVTVFHLSEPATQAGSPATQGGASSQEETGAEGNDAATQPPPPPKKKSPPPLLQQEGVIRADGAALAEPERLFWLHQNIFKDSILVGFGGDAAGYYAALWARWLKNKSLVMFRGNDFDRNIHNMKRSWMTHFILQQAELVGAVSTEMVERISTIRDKPTFFTPNSIDTEEWVLFACEKEKARAWRKENLPQDKPVIGMFGELKTKKGLDIAHALFTTFHFQERAYLLTVGSVPEATCEALEAALGENWKHVPFQGRGKLPPFYDVCDIVFMPSLYDGMPNVLLEAMALGKLPVTSRAAAFPDVVRDGVNGFLFDTGDIADAARVLDTALQLPPGKKARMEAEAAKTIMESFTPQKEIQHIVDALGIKE
ncbi:MAG: glycosyltransferase family 4 protein [bacterium]|nr:glycosyltransferase family 4 protein [bacterium]